MQIYDITDQRFTKYGRIVQGIDFTELVNKMQEMPLPKDVVYEPSVPALEELAVAKKLQEVYYGELPIEVGYCNGHNTMLNAVEYHRSSEINVVATDAVLILGCQQDITADFTYDTANMEAFLIPKGTAVEVYATTLHYAPCHVKEEGFLVTVVLPKGTNYPLETEHKSGEDALITAKNKWLIGHPDADLPAGTHLGLVGKNINIAGGMK